MHNDNDYDNGDNGNDYDNERKHGKCLMIVFGKRNKIDASIFLSCMPNFLILVIIKKSIIC